jgi:uracil phosphoribosyltransferase
VAAIYPSSHPLVHHKLAALRDASTGPAEFRRLTRSLALLLAQEALADLPTRAVSVTTPLGPCPSRVLDDRIMLVPILRAGLGMTEGVLELVPEAEVRHIGLFRDEATLLPTEYYNRLPARCQASIALVLDPMLATGGSLVRACEILREAGIGRVKVLSLIAAPEGLRRLQQAMPDVPIHVGAVDEKLTDVGFIYPGLGDAGDRQFATEPGTGDAGGHTS